MKSLAKTHLHSSDSIWTAKSLISGKNFTNNGFSSCTVLSTKTAKDITFSCHLQLFTGFFQHWELMLLCVCLFLMSSFLVLLFLFAVFFTLVGWGVEGLAVNNLGCCFVRYFLLLSFFLCPFYSASLISSSITSFLQEISIGLRFLVVSSACR